MNTDPVVIAGNGGSGTRVVAQILIQAGAFLGSDMNPSFDNLMFTYLFKHPKQFSDITNQFYENPQKFKDLFSLHEKLLQGKGLVGTKPEWDMILHAAKEHAQGRYNWTWVLERWSKMIATTHTDIPPVWGWKEPHSIFFLDPLSASYPAAKFVLVLRNGLDMTYTKTDQQFKFWAHAYNIDPSDESPRNIFEFWYQLNKHAIELGKKHFNQNFHIIKFEDLCLSPETTIPSLLDFVGLGNTALSQKILNIPRLPASSGRYKDFNTSWIDAEVKDRLLEIGYNIALIEELKHL